jgi:hypothetical protein
VAASSPQGIAEGAMESITFWRDAEARFLALPGPTDDLHATRSDGTAAAFVAAQSEKLVTAIRTPEYPIEAIVSLATGVARVARWLLDGLYVCRWIVSGGPANEKDRAVLQSGWRREAKLAAWGADLVRNAATDDEAIDEWINLIERSDGPYVRLGDWLWIDDLPAASAAMCAELAARAYASDRAGSRSGSLASCSDPADRSAEGLAIGATAERSPSTAVSTPASIAQSTDVARIDPIAVFRRRTDRCWHIAFGGQESDTVAAVKGFEWISQLLASPRCPVPASALLADRGKNTTELAAKVTDAVHDESLTVRATFSDAGAPDSVAQSHYRQRLSQIEIELANLDENIHAEDVAELQRERDNIRAELRRPQNARRIGSNRERARKAAARQYHSALKTLQGAGLVGLAEHLRLYLKPGHTFEYVPSPPVHWHIDPHAPAVPIRAAAT